MCLRVSRAFTVISVCITTSSSALVFHSPHLFHVLLVMLQIKRCDGVLVFTVPDDVAVARLVARGETSGRADDNEETIRTRLQVSVQSGSSTQVGWSC